MGLDLLLTFVSHHVQPLRQREMTTWMYPGPSCPDHPFSIELYDTKINTWRGEGVLAHGANQNIGSGPIPLREGVNIPWVSLLELTSLSQFMLLNAYAFLCRISGVRAMPHGGSPYPRIR
jgi:hypothetical protein